ncbi:hypothetical protein F5Y19DRAFT_471825 [Xylariaceae sp. FL1651]|nr:hypothetical protein F5Y19DRAFT_471825 [Xylariaceae sp. FL1651]
MASLGPKDGKALAENLGRSTSSASLSSVSSDSEGGGVLLQPRIKNMSIKDAAPQRSIETDSHAEPTNTTTTSQDLVRSTHNKFQIGGPPRDDEEVFDSKPSDARGAIVSSTAIVNKSVTPSSQAIVPIRTQVSSAERRHLVSGVDAQTYYPPEACVFVANLPEHKTDVDLETAVTKVFAAFGPVFVKIRRDPKNMPFAFCQYTDPRFAERAQRDGKGMLIEGRSCRTEMVRANRSFVMYSIEGHQVDVAEARKHVWQYGPIEKIEPLQEHAARIMEVSGAVFIEFEQFDPGRDIIAAYRHHEQYRIIAYDLKKTTQPRTVRKDNYLQRYEVDRRSIYVGNLPNGVDNIEEILRVAASAAGTVDNIQMVEKPARNEGGRPTIFAFVEYERPDEAIHAVDCLRGTILAGSRIRVERKKSRDGVAPLRNTNVQPSPGNKRDEAVRDEAVCAETLRDEVVHSQVVRETGIITPVNKTDDLDKVPATPARPTAVSVRAAVASGSGSVVNQVAPRSMSPNPDYRHLGFTQRRTFVTPHEVYQQRPTFIGPNQGFQPGPFVGAQAYQQAQYISPNQGFQQGQFISPNYALSASYDARAQFGQGYHPATPQINPAMHALYDGGSGGYFPTHPPPHPYWPTPFLQDANDGYRYYAGYGQSVASVASMASVSHTSSVVDTAKTHTHTADQTAQQEHATGSEEAGEKTNEEKTDEEKK